MSTKDSWPELVGKTGEEATAAIKKERPELFVQIKLDGQPVTEDYGFSRVRIFVDKNNKVAHTPRIG